MKGTRRRMDAIVAKAVVLIACLLAGTGGFGGGAMAAGGTSDLSVSMCLPLIIGISRGVHVLPNHFSCVSSIGSLTIVGEVQNDTAQYLELVTIIANVLDSGGQLLTTADSYIALGSLSPGERTCFGITGRSRACGLGLLWV